MKNNILSINEYRNNPEFYFAKGLRFANKKNLGEAYRNLNKALQLEPDNSEYKFNMACFLSELQHPKEANRMFKDILINFEPTMYECFFGLGCNSFEVGDNEKAAENFDKYLYFDADGEFSYEISEMAFYLKLYSETSHDNKFLKTSASNLKKGQKYLRDNNIDKAISFFYKSIISNPLNLEARNLLTLALIEKKQYIRASYINASVHNIDSENIWGFCLGIFILFSTNKLSRVNRALNILPYRPIDNREDLLCAAMTLMIFDRVDGLIKLIEMHIVEFYDALIYAILLLGYSLTNNTEKVEELNRILNTYYRSNDSLKDWVDNVAEHKNQSITKQSPGGHLINLFTVIREPVNFRYYPSKYVNLKESEQFQKRRLSKKLASIIEGAVSKREIMYSRFYKKEIMDMLFALNEQATQLIEAQDGSYEMYSAALEYAYCKLFHIDMKKNELVKKYKITSELFEKAIKVFGI